MLTKLSLALFALAIAMMGFARSAQATICEAIAGNLVTNCGFETGDFTGWTTIPAASGSDFGITTTANSGVFAADFGATTVGQPDTIEQTIPTNPGTTYDVTFFLQNEFVAPNQFVATFGGTPIFSVTDAGPFAYTEISADVLATGPSTLLTFAGYQVPAFFDLDDVSVVPLSAVPEPPSIALLAVSLLGLGFLLRRGARPTPL